MSEEEFTLPHTTTSDIRIEGRCLERSQIRLQLALSGWYDEFDELYTDEVRLLLNLEEVDELIAALSEARKLLSQPQEQDKLIAERVAEGLRRAIAVSDTTQKEDAASFPDPPKRHLHYEYPDGETRDVAGPEPSPPRKSEPLRNYISMLEFCRLWLNGLDSEPEEKEWFSTFAQHYPSQQEAAIAYLAATKTAQEFANQINKMSGHYAGDLNRQSEIHPLAVEAHGFMVERSRQLDRRGL